MNTLREKYYDRKAEAKAINVLREKYEDMKAAAKTVSPEDQYFKSLGVEGIVTKE